MFKHDFWHSLSFIDKNTCLSCKDCQADNYQPPPVTSFGSDEDIHVVEANNIDQNNLHICVFCSKNATGNERSESMRKKLKEDAFFIKTISKVIVSATENSLMPLVQLSLMFPKMLFWFQKVPKNTSLKSCFDSAKFNFSNPDNLDMIPKCIENLEPSWVFGFTIASIVMSLLSINPIRRIVHE